MLRLFNKNFLSTYKSRYTYNIMSNRNLNYFKSNFSFKLRPHSSESNIPIETYEINKIRNIGIIAHIDAGKTTTTERMLFYSGVISSPGEVHYGNTVTDYLEQERERGITIRAAAISFDWRDHQINLIDTPGHIDFTGEVERSLRVLDSAVVILDASMGVETQTITVWKQADKYKLPRIAFINKIDKAGASVENTLWAMHQRLGVKSLLINFPTGEENMFTGLVDLIQFKIIVFKDQLGLEYDLMEITEDMTNFKKYSKMREIMIEELANHDESLMNSYIEGKDITQDEIIRAIRKALVENKITLTLCGSSLKNKGVQQLLDSIVAFFPSPLDCKPVQAKRLSDNSVIDKHCSNEKGKACGIIFKIINDKEKGSLAFFKLYEGALKIRNFIKYTNKSPIVKERIVQILRMKANECLQLNQINAGDIGALIGLKEAQSGDTIVEESENEVCVLPGVFNPDPVFFCSIIPKRNSDYRTLISILENLNKEDPSFHIRYDRDTAQTLICGLGELHLEIIKDRIELEHGIQSTLGKMKVSFKESIRKTTRNKFIIEKEFNGNQIYFEIELELYPIEVEYTNLESQNENFDVSSLFEKDTSEKINEIKEDLEEYNEKKLKNKFLFTLKRYEDDGLKIEIDPLNDLQLNIKHNKSTISLEFEKASPFIESIKTESGDEEVFKSLNFLTPDEKRVIFESVLENLNSGSLLGYPLVNVGVKIVNGKFSNMRTNEIAMKVSISEAMKTLLRSADPVFMEPFMLVEVICPNYASSQVISDLTGNRRGKIISIVCENQTNTSLSDNSNNFAFDFLIKENKHYVQNFGSDDIASKIYALAPLSELVGYTAFIRSITRGEGKFFMKFQEFDQVGVTLQNRILDGSYFYE